MFGQKNPSVGMTDKRTLKLKLLTGIQPLQFYDLHLKIMFFLRQISW